MRKRRQPVNLESDAETRAVERESRVWETIARLKNESARLKMLSAHLRDRVNSLLTPRRKG